MNARRAARQALRVHNERVRVYQSMAPLALKGGDTVFADFVTESILREHHSAVLLERRLRRKPFRIKWLNLITVLGASALFVWVLLILMEGKFG